MKPIISCLECSSTIKFLNIVGKAQLFPGTLAQWLYPVIVKYKIAVRTQQVVSHQICIVRRREELAFACEQSFANLKRQAEMVEGVELIYKDERGLVQVCEPVIKDLQ